MYVVSSEMLFEEESCSESFWFKQKLIFPTLHRGRYIVRILQFEVKCMFY